MSDPFKGKWTVRKTVDETGDYPFPTYEVLAIHKYGPECVACAFQNPKVANAIAAIPAMLEACNQALSHIENEEAMFGSISPLGDVLRNAISETEGKEPEECHSI